MVEVAAPVLRDLQERAIPPAILEAFGRLVAEDGQLACRPLDGKPMAPPLTGQFRWKLGSATRPWRVLYEVDEEQWSVTVLAIGQHGSIYH